MNFIDLFRPNRRHSDFSGRASRFLLVFFMLALLARADDIDKINKLSVKCREGDRKACEKLAKIAMNDIDRKIRQAAVEKITDQEILIYVALHDTDRFVRQKAVYKITDQSTLNKIARNDENFYTRCIAVNKISDQAILAQIAKTDEDSSVREDAVQRLNDPAILTEIALKDISWSVRKKAIENSNLTDQAVLAEVAIMDKYNDSYALEKLTAASLISQVAVEAKNESIRKRAMELLPPESRDSLINAARLRWEQVENLSDQAALISIAENDKHFCYRLSAVNKISSQDTLAKIAMTDKDIYVCLAAVEKLTGQPLLFDIVKKSGSFLPRLAAVRKIDDQSYLADIANQKELPMPIIRTAASKLEDRALIEKVISNNPELMPTLAELSLAKELLIDNKFVEKFPVSISPGYHSLNVSISTQVDYYNGPVVATGQAEIAFYARAGNMYYIDPQITDKGTYMLRGGIGVQKEIPGKSWNPVVKVMKDELDFFLNYEMQASYRHFHYY